MDREVETEKVYREFEHFLGEQFENRVDPLICAGIMLAQALKIYRTALEDQEFNDMLDSVLRDRDMITAFQPPQIH
tara:strand:- start:274 stop:501 length:228 start_codon:yes stop_codon:yes gene_type:complete